MDAITCYARPTVRQPYTARRANCVEVPRARNKSRRCAPILKCCYQVRSFVCNIIVFVAFSHALILIFIFVLTFLYADTSAVRRLSASLEAQNDDLDDDLDPEVESLIRAAAKVYSFCLPNIIFRFCFSFCFISIEIGCCSC